MSKDLEILGTTGHIGPGGRADPSNTKEETQKPRQKEEIEEYVPNKTTG